MASRWPHGTPIVRTMRSHILNKLCFHCRRRIPFTHPAPFDLVFSLSDPFIRRTECRRSSLNGTHRCKWNRCLFISIKFIASYFAYEADESAGRYSDIPMQTKRARFLYSLRRNTFAFKLLLLFNLLNSISMQNMTSLCNCCMLNGI